MAVATHAPRPESQVGQRIAVIAWHARTAAGTQHRPRCFVGTSTPDICTSDLVAPLARLPVEQAKAAVVSIKPPLTRTNPVSPTPWRPVPKSWNSNDGFRRNLSFCVVTNSAYDLVPGGRRQRSGGCRTSARRTAVSASLVNSQGPGNPQQRYGRDAPRPVLDLDEGVASSNAEGQSRGHRDRAADYAAIGPRPVISRSQSQSGEEPSCQTATQVRDSTDLRPRVQRARRTAPMPSRAMPTSARLMGSGTPLTTVSLRRIPSIE